MIETRGEEVKEVPTVASLEPEVGEEEKPKARPNFPIVIKRNPYKPPSQATIEDDP